MTTSAVKYKISTLKLEHEKSVIELFVKSFCDDEPLTKHLNISYQDYRPFAEEVVKKAIKEGLSVVAVDENDRAIACTIAEDIANPFVPNLSRYPKMQPIIGLLEEVSRPFLHGKVFHKDKLSHVLIAIVAKEYRGKGLSTQIDMACAELLVRKGFSFVYAEFTGEASESITHHYKVIQLCNRINYDNFKFQGKMPFQGVSGSITAYVIGIKPGIQLDSLPKCYVVQGSYHG